MGFSNFWNSPSLSLNLMRRRQRPQLRQVRHFWSQSLERDVDIDIYLPPDFNAKKTEGYPLLLVNDGQDLYQMHFEDTLERLYRTRRIPHLVVISVHANHDRMREYGTADWPDYKNRGDKAGLYRDFILTELLPFGKNKFNLNGRIRQTAFIGFSLGGLSALDMAYAYPQIFGVAGVFSGALWWRHQPFNPFEPDNGRIMHHRIHHGREWDNRQRYWLQVGDKDETDDRNNNGVIDSIDDTIDLIRALKLKGVSDDAVRYLEIENGEHNQQTWAAAMPDFLVWAFG